MPGHISTPFGHAVPPAYRHSVTFHIPLWANIESWASDPRPIVASLENAYPRMKPHRDINALAAAVLKLVDQEERACRLFPSIQSARECVKYSTSPRRDNGIDKKPLSPDELTIRSFHCKDTFYAVLFPRDKSMIVDGFWQTPGSGVSSRFAEINLEMIDQLREDHTAMSHDKPLPRLRFEGSAHDLIRQRILACLKRSPRDPHPSMWPSTEDIYLFPTGMASVYKFQSYLNRSPAHQGTTILFGMAFTNTVIAFQEFGLDFKFLGNGSDEDLRELELFLSEHRSKGGRIQAIWAEFPANPILVVPDLKRLRSLADNYDTILIIDDTIGSFANVDVLPVADVLVTSLTKSFNGYADAMAGSLILNPTSRQYQKLKALFDDDYVPELYIADAEMVEQNSRDYMSRTARHNDNAHALADYFLSLIDDPSQLGHGLISKVHYPSVSPSGKYFRDFMRPSTQDFSPGFGCLLNIELIDMPTTKIFYDNLYVHCGPHLGAPSTLVLPYTMAIYGSKLEWARQYGLKPAQLRIAAGLEDTEELVAKFKKTVEETVKELKRMRDCEPPVEAVSQ